MCLLSFQIWLTIISLFVKAKTLFMNVMEIWKFNIETSIYEFKTQIFED
jgi:hypothetical protein